MSNHILNLGARPQRDPVSTVGLGIGAICRGRRKDAGMDRVALNRAATGLRRVAVFGVFTTAMAREAGFTRGAIRNRTTRGAWRHVIGSAYVDAAEGLAHHHDLHRRAVGAALSWSGSVICLRTAALLHGLPLKDDGLAHVVVPDARRRTAGMVPYFFRVDPAEIHRLPGVRATSIERTAIDCLMRLPAREAGNLMAWIRTREVLSDRDLAKAIDVRAGRRGVGQLRRVERLTRDGALSELERRLHRVLHAAGITGWEANAVVRSAGRILARADVLFPAQRLILEADGKAFHQDFEGERARLNALTLAGYTVLRFTWSQITQQQDDVVRQVRGALALAAARRA